jgi:ribonuclease BN (tRNA processing enzyme)
MERTGFFLPEIGVVLDAGVDLPLQSSLVGNGVRAILVSHGHIDHMNALPALLRHCGDGAPPIHIMAPAPIVHRLREFCQLSWACKVDADEELPAEYAPPPDEDAHANPGSMLQQGLQTWRPVEGGMKLQVAVGKKAATTLEVHTTQLWHRSTAIGYVLGEPARSTHKFRRELIGTDKHVTAANVKAAQARGEPAYEEVQQQARLLLAFVTDTTIQVSAPAGHTDGHGWPLITCARLCNRFDDLMSAPDRHRRPMMTSDDL